MKIAVSPQCRAKERARFLADCAVAAKESLWKCVSKSTPGFELVIVLQDSAQHPSTAHTHTQTDFCDPCKHKSLT